MKKLFNLLSESVFLERLFIKIKYFPAATFTRIRYFIDACREIGYSWRHKQPIRYGVCPEWLRQLLNIYRIK